MKLLLILGNQLFSPEVLRSVLRDHGDLTVFMREDRELCTHFRYHKHKIIFFLAAMREYAEEIRAAKIHIHYEFLNQDSKKYEDALTDFIKDGKFKSVVYFEIEDKFFEVRIDSILTLLGVKKEIIPSPMFLTSRQQFKDYLSKNKKPFMKTFYQEQRKRLNILLEKDGSPIGGKWSYDEQNRKALPKDQIPPSLSKPRKTKIQLEVMKLVTSEFSDHPGDSDLFWLPTDRSGAVEWLDHFLKTRLNEFGPYEDALSKNSPFLYHSVLTPFLNTGLLSPEEVLQKTLRFYQKESVPLSSAEGFIRQIIGWREFIRGIYQNFGDQQKKTNFWRHERKLTDYWYKGNTGIEPLDDVIKKTVLYGYAHHIERLMVVGSLMNLLQIDPLEAHKWFMELFIDSSDWVMGPNVFGMALFSDGGIFATKPYLCGSNYLRKMGSYKNADWCDGVDGLYWRFIDTHKDFFSSHYRLSMMVKMLEKMPKEKKIRLFEAADKIQTKLTK